eukprot:136297-Chlamydomonas_euryale.AAC.1
MPPHGSSHHPLHALAGLQRAPCGRVGQGRAARHAGRADACGVRALCSDALAARRRDAGVGGVGVSHIWGRGCGVSEGYRCGEQACARVQDAGVASRCAPGWGAQMWRAGVSQGAGRRCGEQACARVRDAGVASLRAPGCGTQVW